MEKELTCECREEYTCQECLADFLADFNPEVPTYPAGDYPVSEGTDDNPPW